MSKVTLTPYILTDANGSNPRIMIPVDTPAAFVMVESPRRDQFLVSAVNRDGVRIAIDVAKQYARSHRPRFDQLYSQMDRIRHSA